MRIVVIDGTGFIGAQVVELLRSSGHDPVIAAPPTGVDAFSGEGLAEAVARADAVIDVSDSPTRDPDGMLAFFTTFGRQIADRATVDGRAKVPPVLVQPVAPAEVAAELVRLAAERARAGTVEIAGPEVVRLDHFLRGTFEILGDEREVETDAMSPLMGTDGAPEGALIPDPASGHPLTVGRTAWREMLAEVAAERAR